MAQVGAGPYKAPMDALAELSTYGGEPGFDEQALDDYGRDFGGLVHGRPSAVLTPGGPQDLAAACRWCAARGLKLAARGTGHSTFGRSQAPGGVVVDMSSMRSIGPLQGEHLRVEAGARWSDVVDVAHAHGKTPPVLTDYLELSVGGTLAVGGLGAQSGRRGMLTDHVLALDVVTGAGNVELCTARHNRELFDAVRGGLGQVGVITAATIALVDAPKSVRRHLLFYPGLAAMLDDARRLAREQRFDAVQGAIVRPQEGGLAFRLEIASYFDDAPPADRGLLSDLVDEPSLREAQDLSFLDYLRRLRAEPALTDSNPAELPHPWLTTLVGDSRLASVVEAELGSLDWLQDVGPLGQIAVSPLRREAFSTPLVQMPDEALSWTFNVFRQPASADAGEAARMVSRNRATYERIRDAGGRLYPNSALALTTDEWQAHFSTTFDAFAAAKELFDPDGILTPGYPIF